jgi:hypothetical protein
MNEDLICYLLQFGLYPVPVVSKLVHKYKRDNYIHNEKQYTRQYKKNKTHKTESKT